MPRTIEPNPISGDLYVHKDDYDELREKAAKVVSSLWAVNSATNKQGHADAMGEHYARMRELNETLNNH